MIEFISFRQMIEIKSRICFSSKKHLKKFEAQLRDFDDELHIQNQQIKSRNSHKLIFRCILNVEHFVDTKCLY
jgi:hypothetical protein